MRKEANKDREEKVWCWGKDLRILQELSLPDEEWEYLSRVVDEPLGDCYLVSNMGRVYHCGKQELCTLYPADDKTRYVKVSLEKVPEGHKLCNVQRLVAAAFVLNPAPDRKRAVHHIDGDQTNNKAVNLLWVENGEHRIAHVLKNGELAVYCDWVASMRDHQPIKHCGALLPLSWEEMEQEIEHDKNIKGTVSQQNTHG